MAERQHDPLATTLPRMAVPRLRAARPVAETDAKGLAEDALALSALLARLEMATPVRGHTVAVAAMRRRVRDVANELLTEIGECQAAISRERTRR